MSERKPLSAAEQALSDAALDYHRAPTRGKISVTPTKPLMNQRDLSLAYSPGVAYACLAIEANPALAAEFTSRANLVGVITNGTAVLGLGNIGALAGKPVMEGKGCLFKKFAGIDVFDIELAEHDPDKLVDIIAALEPTLGGINLEDIKAPECFTIERKLRERLKIPVFHDDQHGTAIISAAALLNGLEIVGKQLADVKVAVSGAGAAAIACLDLMLELGVRRENVFVCDSRGVLHDRRSDTLDASKQRYVQATPARTLEDVTRGADVFLGCSAAGVLTPDMVKAMASRPIILALANPEPEIRPELALAARPDCLIATGRSDYPNQVNNVLCFPVHLPWRARLRRHQDLRSDEGRVRARDRGPRQSRDQRRSGLRLSRAHAALRRRLLHPDAVRFAADPAHRARGRARGRNLRRSHAADRRPRGVPAVAHALRHAHRPLHAPGVHGGEGVAAPHRVCRRRGRPRVARRAVRQDEGMVQPILIGRPAVIESRVEKAGLRLQAGRDYQVVNPEDDPRFRQYWDAYHKLNARDGVTPDMAKATLRRSNTTIAAMMVKLGDADGMLCGLVGRYDGHLEHVREVVGLREGAKAFAALNALMLEQHTLFIADTFVNDDPDAEQLADIAAMAAEEVQRFGLVPKLAFLSHSMYGSSSRPAARKMRRARDLFVQRFPQIEADGEMHGDAALSEDVRKRFLHDSTLHGVANVLILPNLDAANILFNVLKMTGGQGVTVGPLLLGAALPVHILTPSSTMRRVVNMTALTVAHAAARG